MHKNQSRGRRGTQQMEQEQDQLPISQLFQRHKHSSSSSFSTPISMGIHEYHLKSTRNWRKGKHFNNDVIIALPAAAKRKAENTEASSSVLKRVKEVRANLTEKFPSFSKIVIPCMVFRCFLMILPKKFCQLHLPDHDSKVILVDGNGKEYRIQYLVQRRALSGGWRKFCLEHSLVVGDALVFQLIKPSKFKVYTVRINCFGEVDGALNLLRFKTCINHAGKKNAEPSTEHVNQCEVHMNALPHLKAEGNPSGNGSMDIVSIDESKQLKDAVRFSKICTPRADFVGWNNGLSGFEVLSMEVEDKLEKAYEASGN